MNIKWNTAWENSIWVAAYRVLRSESKGNLPAEINDLVGKILCGEGKKSGRQIEVFEPDSPIALKATFQERLPAEEFAHGQLVAKLEQELSLRLGVAKQEWAARGPGWLFALQRFLNLAGVAKGENESAEIEVVLPYGEPVSWPSAEPDCLGWLAPVMYNVSPLFPEWLRVAWLVARKKIAGTGWASEVTSSAAKDPVVGRSIERETVVDLLSALMVVRAASDVDVCLFDLDTACSACKFLISDLGIADDQLLLVLQDIVDTEYWQQLNG